MRHSRFRYEIQRDPASLTPTGKTASLTPAGETPGVSEDLTPGVKEAGFPRQGRNSAFSAVGGWIC